MYTVYKTFVKAKIVSDGTCTEGVPCLPYQGLQRAVQWGTASVLTCAPYLYLSFWGGTALPSKRENCLGCGTCEAVCERKAIDVALTALRLGANEVTLACLETREEMPANRWEIEEALEEGVILMPSWGPKQIIAEKGRVSSAELVQCTCVFDEEGNFCPVFGTETTTVGADQVILAIGQAPDLSCIGNEESLRVEKGLLAVDYEMQSTEIPWVFAGGDITSVSGTIVDAIAAGRRAASSIDRFLGGDGLIDETLAERSSAEWYTGKREAGFADLKRAVMPTMPVSQRHGNFNEVEQGFDEELAVDEAKRCLRCDL
jgi:NAD-dependent dihydropyrimidine dehydrogenase PreA subunit